MKQFAILCGAAPEDFHQKKLISIHDFLISKQKASLPERNIAIFPNGVNELLLESVLNNCIAAEGDEIFLYFFCASLIAEKKKLLSWSMMKSLRI